MQVVDAENRRKKAGIFFALTGDLWYIYGF